MSAITLRSLADFKRALALPGMQVTLVHSDFVDAKLAAAQAAGGDALQEAQAWRDRVYGPRSIDKVQTNGVWFRLNDKKRTWLNFGKAADWSFDGAQATVTTDGKSIVYELSMPAGA